MNTATILIREFKIIIESGKKYIIWLIILNTICKGVQPFVLLQVPKMVLTMVEQRDSTEKIIAYIALYCMVSFVLFYIVQRCDAVFKADFNELRQHCLANLNELYQKIDYESLENSKFQENAYSAKRGVLNPTGIEGVCGNFTDLCAELFTALIYLMFLIKIKPTLAILCVVCTGGCIMTNKRISQLLQKGEDFFSALLKKEDAFVGIGHDFAYGKDIRLFSMAEQLDNEFWKLSAQTIKKNKELEDKVFKAGVVSSIVVFIRDAFSYIIIIRDFFSKNISIGNVVLCVEIIVSLSSIIEKVTDLSIEWVKSLSNAKNYFDFWDKHDFLKESEDDVIIPQNKTLKIEFQKVSFQYPGTRKWIIKNFDFTLEEGHTLAIVGGNGTGKSTVVKLITGMLHPTEGKILINGIEQDKFGPIKYYDMFSAVYQEPVLYAMTVLENVMGIDDDNKSKIRSMACLKKVGMQKKIESLPMKYDTPVLRVIDKNGVEFSGGQIQQIAIARALYKNANMVLLDEPTAALDARHESKIYKAFNDLAAGKTAIYVSHRLSSTIFCDHILMFTTDGKIEYGTHEELMNHKGEYYKMFETQGKYYQ